jgi:hypothetical protein
VYGSNSQRAASALVGKCMEGHDSRAGSSNAAELQGSLSRGGTNVLSN